MIEGPNCASVYNSVFFKEHDKDLIHIPFFMGQVAQRYKWVVVEYT